VKKTISFIFYFCKFLKITEEAKLLLKIHPLGRSNDHVKLICSQLHDLVPEFQDFPLYIQKAIIKRAFLQEFEPGRIIIRQNHRAFNYYIILSGIGNLILKR
jgi:hypothetical protein